MDSSKGKNKLGNYVNKDEKEEVCARLDVPGVTPVKSSGVRKKEKMLLAVPAFGDEYPCNLDLRLLLNAAG